ncbi:MAG: helix-turn-helix domain-containing protein [Angustibacter sp.]
MVLLRQEIGDVLREQRRCQSRTLRQVSARARVSLGYLSEIERGQKEASSELLASICDALEVPLSQVLSRVSERAADAERTAEKPADIGALPLAANVQRVDITPNGLVSAA